MDDVYLLNNPFTFQAMEKHSAYCAMIRLGLKVPETWMVPHKVPTTVPRREYMVAQVRAHGLALQPPLRARRRRGAGRLPAVHEAVRRGPVGRRDADRGRRRAAHPVRRLGPAADASAGVGRGVRRVLALALDRRRDDGDALRPGRADAPPVPGRPRVPLAGDRLGGSDDLAARERVLPLGVQLLREPRARHRSAPDRLRERLTRRRADEPPLLLPVGDGGPRQVVCLLHRDGTRHADRPGPARVLRHRRPRGPHLPGQAAGVPPARRRLLPGRRVRGVLRDVASRRPRASSSSTSRARSSTRCSSRRCSGSSRRTSTRRWSRVTAGSSTPGWRTRPRDPAGTGSAGAAGRTRRARGRCSSAASAGFAAGCLGAASH